MSRNGNASLGRPMPDAKRPRNPYDRSYKVKFTSKVGHLLPIFKLWSPAGSHVRLNRREFMRTFDINTAAFEGFKHCIDFFAVNLNDIWGYWDNWYLNINDMHSSAFNALQAGLNGSDVDAQVKMRTNVPGNSITSILGLSDLADNLLAGTGEIQYTRVEDVEGTPTEVTYDSNTIRRYNARRLLNLLGYPVTVAGELDENGQFLGMTPDELGYVHDNSNQINNLIPLCVYQKIYFEHFRNNSYEAQNPFYYNLDWLGNSNDNPAVTNSNLIQFYGHITQLRSANYRKDFFQSAYPALDYVPSDASPFDWEVPTNVGNLSGILQVATGSDAGRWNYSGLYGYLVNSGGQNILKNDSPSNLLGNVAGENQNLSHTHIYEQSLGPNAYNVQAIRAAFALDKLKRASAYAPRHVKDQYEARFGFKYKGEHHHSIKIGSFATDINAFEVTQTSPTSINGDLSPLGTIGGKGIGSSGHGDEITFDCMNSDYMIMAVSYFMPRLNYDSFRFDPFLIKFSRNDFFQPEFENQGLQPVYQKLIAWSKLTDPTLADVANNILRFWQARYQEYKTGIDTNFGLFNRGCMLSQFTTHFNLDKRVFGMSGLDWRFFKVLPDDVDNMFVTHADQEELSDQFYGQVTFDVDTTELMSVHGMPSL